MTFNSLFPRALCASRIARTLFSIVVVSLLGSTAAQAQSPADQVRPRVTTSTVRTGGISALENEPIVISLADDTEPESTDIPKLQLFTAPTHRDQMLLAAIDTRLGAPYVYGAAGPRVFDCSGFVWSVFKSAGLGFERTSARTLWAEFAPAQGNERLRFGTLVFFNNLQHVGIVADENGFYHASRSHGVTYSPFKGYWEDRVDGFRKVNVSAASLIATE